MSLGLHYALDFTLLLGIFLVLICRKKFKESSRWHKLSFVLFYIYISLMLYVTLMPFQLSLPRPGESLARYNLIPFMDIRMGYLGAKREAILNVLMFMPMGFLLPELRDRRFFSTLICGFAVSLGVESIQLMFFRVGTLSSRSFDVTDLITNTAGTLLGYLIWLILRPLIRRLEALLNKSPN